MAGLYVDNIIVSQSNGKAESAVKIAKRLLKKATQDKKDTNLAILAWRNTPSIRIVDDATPARSWFLTCSDRA